MHTCPLSGAMHRNGVPGGPPWNCRGKTITISGTTVATEARRTEMANPEPSQNYFFFFYDAAGCIREGTAILRREDDVFVLRTRFKTISEIALNPAFPKFAGTL